MQDVQCTNISYRILLINGKLGKITWFAVSPEFRGASKHHELGLAFRIVLTSTNTKHKKDNAFRKRDTAEKHATRYLKFIAL
mmetsp:Transcript_122804/g.191726  ORF Transcript_122804/g.191726 Transcript_122804/m.191726 type:complete len:82 (+) Transcript_122804:155-400(+)